MADASSPPAGAGAPFPAAVRFSAMGRRLAGRCGATRSAAGAKPRRKCRGANGVLLACSRPKSTARSGPAPAANRRDLEAPSPRSRSGLPVWRTRPRADASVRRTGPAGRRGCARCRQARPSPARRRNPAALTSTPPDTLPARGPRPHHACECGDGRSSQASRTARRSESRLRASPGQRGPCRVLLHSGRTVYRVAALGTLATRRPQPPLCLRHRSAAGALDEHSACALLHRDLRHSS